MSCSQHLSIRRAGQVDAHLSCRWLTDELQREIEVIEQLWGVLGEGFAEETTHDGCDDKKPEVRKDISLFAWFPDIDHLPYFVGDRRKVSPNVRGGEGRRHESTAPTMWFAVADDKGGFAAQGDQCLESVSPAKIVHVVGQDVFVRGGTKHEHVSHGSWTQGGHLAIPAVKLQEGLVRSLDEPSGESDDDGRIAWPRKLPHASQAMPQRSPTGANPWAYAAAGMASQVVTVDAKGAPLAPVERVEAHRPPGRLHLAVSIQLVSVDDVWLLQQRHPSKALFGGRWTNSCCTHPLPGEDLRHAARRRVRDELGVEAAGLAQAGSFVYRAEDPDSGLVEHELDYVFVGRLTAEPRPLASEISAIEWCSLDLATARVNGPSGTPWAGEVLRLAADALPCA